MLNFDCGLLPYWWCYNNNIIIVYFILWKMEDARGRLFHAGYLFFDHMSTMRIGTLIHSGIW